MIIIKFINNHNIIKSKNINNKNINKNLLEIIAININIPIKKLNKNKSKIINKTKIELIRDIDNYYKKLNKTKKKIIIDITNYYNKIYKNKKKIQFKNNPKDQFKNNTKDQLICPICFDHKVNRCTIKCGHLFCSICIYKIHNCAICRTKINQIIKIFF